MGNVARLRELLSDRLSLEMEGVVTEDAARLRKKNYSAHIKVDELESTFKV